MYVCDSESGEEKRSAMQCI
ncbi:hypothetical protein ACN38_g13013, partial [Penicillium nordicum]